MSDLCCVIVASTGGAVMNRLLENAFFKRQIVAVVADRPCGAIDKAAGHGVPTHIIAEKKAAPFCDHLLEYLRDQQADYVISFFTRLFVGELLTAYADRILNLHPSLLPSFKGLDGFGDTLRYGTRFMGTTIHFIDEHMDEGKIILQTCAPIDPRLPESALRHRLFQHQCKSLLQVVKWLSEGRVVVEAGRVMVRNADFVDYEFSPNLDFMDAVRLDVSGF
jgi:phosphoribosylglycinamide formyltransferase-1